MKNEYKKLSIIAVLLINILFLLIFFLESCEYLNLMPRNEWDEKNDNNVDVYLFAAAGNVLKAYEIDYDKNGLLNWKYDKNLAFGKANSSASFISVERENKYLYVNCSAIAPTEILGYYINDNGSLSDLNQFPKNDEFYQMIFDENAYKFYARSANGNIKMYYMDNATGSYENAYDFSFGNVCSNFSLIAGKSGNYLFDLYRNNVNVNFNFRVIKIENEKLTDNGGINDCNFSNGIAGVDIDPSGNYLYLADDADMIRVYFIKNGVLQPVIGSPYAAAAGTRVLKITPDGRFVFVSGSSNQLASYKINPDGTISSIYSLGCTNVPTKICFDPKSRYVFVIADNSGGASIIHIFKINGDGTFTEIAGSPMSADNVKDIAIVQK